MLCCHSEINTSAFHAIYREDICLQTLSLLFKCWKRETKELFVSLANSSLVGVLITIGDVTDIFAIVALQKQIEIESGDPMFLRKLIPFDV